MVEVSITLGITVLVLAALSATLTALHYPRDTDRIQEAALPESQRDFYDGAYSENQSAGAAMATNDDEYGRSARSHASKAGIPKVLRWFVEEHGLTQARGLEIGCGSGLLQDTMDRYVGMDLSFSAGRFFHKPFVQGSATDVPFPDSSFDAAWSIWVFEHVANPEQALVEMRRVVKDGGYILFRPAWNVDSWASEGYEVRPYSDFGLRGKLIKASIPIRLSRWYSLLYTRQVRILRTLRTAMSGKPSRLRYHRLRPNYSKFWVSDSDAAVSLDFYETYLWFTSRGDECVNCPAQRDLLIGGPGPRLENLIVRVNKPGERAHSSAMRGESTQEACLTR